MTDQTAQEPTMEEILASIRRIISEDDAPAETAAAAPEPVVEAAPTPEPVAEAVEPAPVEDEVLELTERYEAPAAESIGDLDVADVAPFPAAEPTPAPESFAAPDYDSLVGESAAASAASAFAGLAATFQKPEAPVAAPQDLPFVSGNTVEAMVQNMLRPMLKDWLDANLPGIVEAQVRKEVERIARNAG
jgi:cell pole-organizing protein PopZ